MNQDQEELPKRLESWKEICEYLNVSVRTAQHYEKNYHLPVYRMPGKKGRVWANTADLDAWNRQTPQTDRLKSTDPRDPVAAVTKSRYPRLLWALLGGVLLVSAFLYWHEGAKSKPVSNLRWNGQDLIALGAAGDEVWRHRFPVLPAAKWYADDPMIWHREGDIDQDGLTEILVLFVSVDHPNRADELFCFSQGGHIRWVFQNRRKISDQAREFTGIYWINHFAFLPPSVRSPGRVVISSNHHIEYPNQIAVLDAEGKLIGEYWHSGHLVAMTVTGSVSDDQCELVLAGVNNGFGQATLVVLDPNNLNGASAQRPGDPYQLKGMARGSEKAVVLFPRSCISDLYGPFNLARQLSVTPSSIEVVVSENYGTQGPYVVYHLDRALAVMAVDLSVEYKSKHREFELEGKFDHPATSLEADRLKQQVAVIK